MAESSARIRAQKERVAATQAGMASDLRPPTTGMSTSPSGRPTPTGVPTVYGPDGPDPDQRGEKRSSSGEADDDEEPKIQRLA